MGNDLKLEVLVDQSRLQEVYDLRVAAYEASTQSAHVSRGIYPNGWSDRLDEFDSVRHWVVLDGRKIVASARVVILEDIADTEGEFSGIELPSGRPFAYWGRLVVHPEYRGRGLMRDLDQVRKTFVVSNRQIKFTILRVVETRNKHLLRHEFEHLGDVELDWNGTKRKFCLFLFVGPDKTRGEDLDEVSSG
jgi:GNAT superfamily N-acetyltransferase